MGICMGVSKGSQIGGLAQTNLHVHQNDIKGLWPLFIQSCAVLAIDGMENLVAGSFEPLLEELEVDGVILCDKDLQRLAISGATTGDAFASSLLALLTGNFEQNTG
jgi:hypothetical protein